MAIVLIIIAVAVGWYVYSAATTPRPDFTIAAPSGVTILANTPTNSIITITAVNQFSGTVLLTAKGSTGPLAVQASASARNQSGAAEELSCRAQTCRDGEA